MKPFLSFCVFLILLQTLIFGSLVKIELPDYHADKWEESGVQKQVVLDPFLMPGKDGLSQNSQNRNEWVPFHYNKVFITRSIPAFPVTDKILLTPGIRNNYKTILVFILNGTLRI